jgi:hypothetical protein
MVAATDDAAVNNGRVYVYSGVSGLLLYQKDGINASDYFGNSLACGDVNGDGYSDFMVGAMGYSAGNNAGRAYAYSGKNGALLYTKDGENASDALGVGLAVGDINGDGYGDLLMGAPAYPQGVNRGKAYICAGTTGNRLASLEGENANDSFGGRMVTGDFDGDGRCDFAIGAIAYGSRAGRLYVYKSQ